MNLFNLNNVIMFFEKLNIATILIKHSFKETVKYLFDYPFCFEPAVIQNANAGFNKNKLNSLKKAAKMNSLYVKTVLAL